MGVNEWLGKRKNEVGSMIGEYIDEKREENKVYKEAYKKAHVKEIRKKAIRDARSKAQGGGWFQGMGQNFAGMQNDNPFSMGGKKGVKHEKNPFEI